MGFVSLLEDITDRHTEDDVRSWRQYLDRNATERDLREARDVLGDPFERPKRTIQRFWTFYQASPVADGPGTGKWEQHAQNLRRLLTTLSPLNRLPNDPAPAWDALLAIERDLTAFFATTGVYGPLSRNAVQQVREISGDILKRCGEVRRYLARFSEQHYVSIQEGCPSAIAGYCPISVCGLA